MSTKPPIEQRITSIAKEAQAALGNDRSAPPREHPHLPPKAPIRGTVSRPPKKPLRKNPHRIPRGI